MISTPNYEEFYQILLTATRQAFDNVHKKHSDEKFYAYGLYTCAWWGYIVPTCNSLEGLFVAASRYKKNSSYAQLPVEQLELQLRWSPCDWEYHVCEEHTFKEVSRWIHHNEPDESAIDWLEYEYEDDRDKDIYGRFSWSDNIERVVESVLKTLTSEGLFTNYASDPIITVGIEGSACPETALRFSSKTAIDRIVDDYKALGYDISYLEHFGYKA